MACTVHGWFCVVDGVFLRWILIVCASRFHFVVNVHDSHRSKLYGRAVSLSHMLLTYNISIFGWIVRFAESLDDWITVAFTLQTYFSLWLWTFSIKSAMHLMMAERSSETSKPNQIRIILRMEQNSQHKSEKLCHFSRWTTINLYVVAFREKNEEWNEKPTHANLKWYEKKKFNTPIGTALSCSSVRAMVD